MFTKTRPLTSARSMVTSTPSRNAAREPGTSSRSMPRSSAKWFRVPAGTTTKGIPCRLATEATRACDPSPPAIPIRSAPPAIASSASSSRSSPGQQHDRLDAAGPALGHQAEPFGLGAAGLRVHRAAPGRRAGSAPVVAVRASASRPGPSVQRVPSAADRGPRRAPQPRDDRLSPEDVAGHRPAGREPPFRRPPRRRRCVGRHGAGHHVPASAHDHQRARDDADEERRHGSRRRRRRRAVATSAAEGDDRGSSMAARPTSGAPGYSGRATATRLRSGLEGVDGAWIVGRSGPGRSCG